MTSAKIESLTAYFDQWEKDVARAEHLLNSDKYFLEGVLVLSCYIGALARLRYPQETKDWKSYKTIVSQYSGLEDIFNNIDLLLFYQWPKSKLANAAIYKGLKNHAELVSILKKEFGDEEDIKGSASRYQDQTALMDLIKKENTTWFDEDNFKKYVELFSNNQILYEFLRCEAVHNADFPLFNASWQPETKKHTYKDNHQVSRNVILTTVKNIGGKLREECLAESKWPWELECV
ncbi:MAG: hypothetical protein MN733_02915 [Nitrososphaera sp.]|nr:hypothetical protein [Nitrososphaera sp.]